MLENLDPFVFSKKLYSLFQELKNKKFVFVQPGGNWGDYLIYMGAEKIAKFFNIKYLSVDYKNFMSRNFAPDEIIYIHGCGGVNHYGSGKAIDLMLKAVNTHKGLVIIGPHTCESDLEFLNKQLIKKFNKNQLDEKKYFFAREMTTYNLYQNLLPTSIKLLHDHDTALNLTEADFKKNKNPKRYNAYFIRYDSESSADKNFKYFGLCIDPASFCVDFDHWVKVHFNAQSIITNRTHSSILGYILHKEVTMMPNIYHKNRSIWEYSLKDKGVKWAEKVTPQKFQKIILDRALTQKVLNSWKVQNFIVSKLFRI